MSREENEPTTTYEPLSNLPCYLTEEEKKMNEDYEWCLHDPEVRRQFGGDVPHAPPFIQLGMQFLLEYHVRNSSAFCSYFIRQWRQLAG